MGSGKPSFSLMDEKETENPGVESEAAVRSPLQYVILALLFLWTVGLLKVPNFCMAGAANRRSGYNQKITDLCVRRVSGDALSWELRADEAMVQDDGERAFLRRINLHYFLVPGQDVFLRGDQAEVDFPSNLIHVQGGIKAESYLGIYLETESLIWNGNARLISTSDSVLIKRPNIEMFGKGLEADLHLENIKIKKNAKTVIH